MAAKAVPLDKQQALDELLRFCTVKLAQEKHGWGSGFFVAPGYILTCAHVVKDLGDKSIKVFWQKTGNPYVPDGQAATNGEQVEFLETEAKVEGLFPDPYDIALLKLTSPIPNHPCVCLDESAQPETSVRTGDELYIFGYPDKDYSNGAPVAASCENLTGDNPRQIKFKSGQIRPGFSGSPLLNHRTRKVCGIVKYTRDKSTDLGGGAIPASAVLSKFSELKEKQKAFHRKHSAWRNLLPAIRCSLQRMVLVTLGVATMTFVARVSGMLQLAELPVFDNLISMRPDEEQDSRVLVITINPDDYKDQLSTAKKEIDDNDISISNQNLESLLTTLKDEKPIAIGLDLERNISLNGHNTLKDLFANTPNLFAICKMPSTMAPDDDSKEVKIDGGKLGAEAPSAVPKEQVGFANFAADEKVVRRHLLAQKPPEDSNCQAEQSLSLVLAGHFLKSKGITYKVSFPGSGICSIQFEKNGEILTSFGNFFRWTGGYQKSDRSYGGCQQLMNYRRRIIKTKSLREIKKGEGLDNIKNQIVLIGTAIEPGEKGDQHETPYGDFMPGVSVQAQMTSHILDAVLKEKQNHPLIWVMPRWIEVFLIYCCSLLGGLIAWRIQSLKHVLITLSSGVFILYLICLLAFFYLALWLPLFPISVVFFASGIGVTFSSSGLVSSTYRKYLGSVS